MREIEHKLLNNPDGAFSEIATRMSYYWKYEERIKDFPKSLIHVGKLRGEIFSYESASAINDGSDALNILGETGRKIRRVVNDL